MKSYVQVLGAGSRECASHSLYYFLEQHRMIFNVSEGLQRLATQHRLKIAPNKMSAIFLTRLDWECFGGLPGMILTVADTARLIEAEKLGGALRIVGPKHLRHALAAMRPFLHRRDFAVEVEELCVDGEISHWRDGKADVDVWALELKENSAGTEVEEEDDSVPVEKTGNVTVEEMEPHHFLLRMFQSEFSVQVSAMEREERCEEYAGRLAQNFTFNGARSLVYLVRGPTQPGKFDKAAALARGIKPGPLFGKLSKGETVTLADGTEINPECCVGPKRSSPAFMIVDISSVALAHAAFANLAKFHNLMGKLEGSSQVETVIHLLGEEVVSDENLMKEYRVFCVKLSERSGDIKHYFCAPNDAVLMSSSVDLQLALSDALEANEFFPSGRQLPNYMENISGLMRPLDRIVIVPGESATLEASQVELSGLAKNFDEIDVASPCQEGIWISALGTGSAIPGKYRNVSSSFIENYETDEMIFLDCGEMTIGQVHRLFGPERAKNLLSRTAAVLISHKHGDHHLGALSLIKTIVRLRGKVLLIAPERFKIWLDEMAQVSDFGLSGVEFVSCGAISSEPFELKSSGTKIKAFEVDHCHEAFGFQITFKAGERIVYSGDTRPCDSVIEHSRECDLLVHEATMSNDLLHEAIIRKHCTIEEAVNVGVQSRSRALLLTHFSQRYAKGALSLDSSQHENVKVAMGVDLLRFQLTSVARVSELALKMSDLLPVDKEDGDAEMEKAE